MTTFEEFLYKVSGLIEKPVAEFTPKQIMNYGQLYGEQVFLEGKEAMLLAIEKKLTN